MFFSKTKRELEIIRAFQKVFYGENKKLSKEGEKVIAFFRDEAGARGELGKNGMPYFYDANNKFDVNAGAFLLGKRRMFDLLIKYLSLDEREVFSYSFEEEKNNEDLKNKLDV